MKYSTHIQSYYTEHLSFILYVYLLAICFIDNAADNSHDNSYLA